MTKNESKQCWVYLAELGDGRLYVGITNNPERRAIEHQLGISIRTTRIFGFRRILYLEPHPNLASARKREQQLKRWSPAKKMALSQGDVARLKELSRSRTTKRREEEPSKSSSGRAEESARPASPASLGASNTFKAIPFRFEASESRGGCPPLRTAERRFFSRRPGAAPPSAALRSLSRFL